MQPKEVDAFLDKVMPDLKGEGEPAGLTLSKAGIPKISAVATVVDPTKELIWPDGHTPSLTVQQKEKIAIYLQKQRGGSHTSLALICHADACEYKAKCPIFQMDPNLVPKGHACPIELTLMEQWLADYRRELAIEEHQVVDLSLLKEFVMWEVYKMRAQQELANDPKIVRREIVGVDQKGNPIYRDVMNPVFNMLDKQTRGKKKLLEALIATRESKAKAGGSTTQTFSGFLSGLMDRISDKKNAKNGNGKLIDATPVKTIAPAKVVEVATAPSKTVTDIIEASKPTVPSLPDSLPWSE